MSQIPSCKSPPPSVNGIDFINQFAIYRGFSTKFLCAGKTGYTGKGMCVQVFREQTVPAVIHQRVELPAGKYSRALLTFLAKMENVKTGSEGKGKHGLFIRALMNRGGQNYAEAFLKKDIVNNGDWKLYQIPIELKNNTDFLTVELGLGSATTGKVTFDNVKLEFK